jgi:aspartate kinase
MAEHFHEKFFIVVLCASPLFKIFQELDNVVEELEKIAIVHLLQQRAIISLIGNVRQMSLILEKV